MYAYKGSYTVLNNKLINLSFLLRFQKYIVSLLNLVSIGTCKIFSLPLPITIYTMISPPTQYYTRGTTRTNLLRNRSMH